MFRGAQLLANSNLKALSGGSEVWTETGLFFSGLRSHADGSVGKQMRDLSFKIEAAAFVPLVVAPTLILKLRITNADAGVLIHSTAICCQMRFEATRPHCKAEEQGLRNSLWAYAWVEVPSFRDSTLVDLPIPCTSDFAAIAAKHFDGHSAEKIPPPLRFSGTALYADAEDIVRRAQILWEHDREFKLPVRIWRDMIDAYPSTSASDETQHSVTAGVHKPRVRGKHCRVGALRGRPPGLNPSIKETR
jgi:Family of unknown function (DUF6084)